MKRFIVMVWAAAWAFQDAAAEPAPGASGDEGVAPSLEARFLAAIARAEESSGREERREWVHQAISIVSQPSAGWLTEQRALALTGLNQDDFTEMDISRLADEIRGQTTAKVGHLYLWGVIGRGLTNETVGRLVEEWKRQCPIWLNDEASREMAWNPIHWCSVLALARQGDPWAVKAAVSLVDDPRLRALDRLWLFRDMAWIRQQEGVEVLKKYVNSDQLTSDAVEDEDFVSPLWVYAARALAHCLVDFPYEDKYDGVDIRAHRNEIRAYLNSHKGTWHIKGRAWPPKGAAVSGPGSVVPPSAAGSGSHATNGSSESAARGSPPARGSSHGREGAHAVKVVAAVACAVIALTGVSLLLRRRRGKHAAGG